MFKYKIVRGKIRKISVKKIIRFCKKNKAISKIGFATLAISGSYSITYNLPDYFGIEGYYSLINNICISYIAALIFFVVQVYIPEEENQKKCMEILKTRFADIAKFNEIAVLLCEKYININEKGATIDWNGGGEKICLLIKSNDELKAVEMAAYTKLELLKWKNVFNTKMKTIKESMMINHCNYEVLEKLSEMEKRDFFTEISSVIRFANSDIDFQSVNNNIKEFKRINEEFKRMCSISEQYQLLDVSENDVLRINAIYKSITNNTFSVQAVNREFIKATIGIQLKDKGVQFSEQDMEMLCDTVMHGVSEKNNSSTVR